MNVNSAGKSITVAGAAGLGVIYRVERWPDLGETVLASEGRLLCGGKAANQAIAIAKLGGAVNFFSAVGSDYLGDVVLAELKKYGVSTGHIVHLSGATLTGTVIVGGDGGNRIVVDPGAVGKIGRTDVELAADTLKSASICLVSGDGFPDEAALAALTIARAAGVPTIFNPAPPPAGDMIDRILAACSLVTPNETEARILAGRQTADPAILAEAIVARGARAVVITLGEHGAFVHDPARGISQRVPAPHIDNVVDTSGAGDAFNGALTLALSRGHELVAATTFACHAAALITQGPGLVDALYLWDSLEPPEVRSNS